MNHISRRRLIGMVGAAGVVTLAGCSIDGGSSDGTSPQTTTQPPTETPTPARTPTPTKTPDNIEPRTYSGNGTKVIQNQQIHSGLVAVEVTYSNLEYDFSSIEIRLQHIEAGQSKLLYGDSGPVEQGEGANVVNETGAYHINVESQGDWEITISQPRAARADAKTPPIDVSGTGQTVSGPYYIEGTRVLTATNDAEGDFIVTLWPMKAPWADFEMPLLEAGPGEYESSFRFDEIGYLHVNSDGNWTVRIE